ncbi:MAG TPA: hypothetical protein VFA18_21820, partial [Gemmataceae bacterium]|nr:hypothetical protein [Gemmataceae bacterium]
FRGLPIVVLMDGTTRGKAALVAAALRSCRHAIIVGQPAQIDPWMHELVTLPEGLGTLRLPTGLAEQVPAPREPRPLLPGQGILPQMLFDGGQVANRVQPDQYVEMSSKQVQQLGEWNLQQHSPEPPAGALHQRPEDPPLARAVSLLQERLKQGTKHSQNAKR